MQIKDNFSITQLFLNKTINVFIDNKPAFTITAQPVKAFYEDNNWNAAYHLFSMNLKAWQDLIPNMDIQETWDYVLLVLFRLSQFQQYKEIGNVIEHGLTCTCPNCSIDWSNKMVKFNDITITPEIWSYVVYLLKLTCGEKVSQPLTFDSPEAREFFLKQQALEDKIQKAKQQKNVDKENLIKQFLLITYYFPNFSFDYLFNQSMAQIRWLQELAAKATSYSFNEKAYAAGNVKKSKKLEFFIK